MVAGGGTGMDVILAHDEAHKQRLREAIDLGVPVHWQEFARLTGTVESAVKRAWMDGALPSAPVDSIPIREGIVALCAVPGALRRAMLGCPVWLLEFDAQARALLGLPDREGDAVYTGEAAASASASKPDELTQYKISHLKAQTAHALQGAKTKEFNLLVKRGEYVKTSDVVLDAAECATNVIAVLQSLPARIGAACEGMSAIEIERRAASEIQTAVAAIQNAAFTGDWG